MADRDVLEVDVVFVGAGPAGLGGAIRLAQLAKQAGKTLSIAVIDKAREIGAHACSGAVMDPKALEELLPGCTADGAPLEGTVEEEFVYFLTREECLIVPFLPPSFHNNGCRIVSLSQLTRWMAKQAEGAGVDLFPGFSAVDALVEDGRVVGVRTGDKGVDKAGQKKSNFEAGVDIRAKVTVVGEGPRGSLTRILMDRFALRDGRTAQVYATGVKEVWEVPADGLHRGRIIHSMGWPLRGDTYGGGFVYTLSGGRVAVGFVVGLDYRDPFLDPHHELQRFKTHPKIRALIEGGKMVEYGAKTIPEGGWEAVPKLCMPGALLVGDSAGLVDSLRLKGIHLAIKSGMLAAETAFDALSRGDSSEAVLSEYVRRVDESYIRKELWKSRHFKKGFKFGFTAGVMGAGIGEYMGGWNPFAGVKLEEGHLRMRTVERYHGRADARPERIGFDEKLTFAKMTDVYHSGAVHEEDQPCHLRVLEPDLCTGRCGREFGHPCTSFCPAGVYEWVRKDEGDPGRLQINFSNCVHCKTCDIMDPYGVIRWVPPEAGGGPAYANL